MLRPALHAHMRQGLFERRDGSRFGDLVMKHCLVEAARVQVFAELLYFEPTLTKELMMAAMLHDFYKKNEYALVLEEGCTWESFAKADDQAQKLLEFYYPERIVSIARNVGHTSLGATENLLQLWRGGDTGDRTLAHLALHYVDDYTRGAGWVEPFLNDENEIDWRMQRNAENPTYAQLNEDGRSRFNGKTTFEFQLEIAKEVEQVLFHELRKRGRAGDLHSPLHIPQYVDEKIRKKIENM